MLTAMLYGFGPFELDPAKAELRKGGEPVALEPQVFSLLAYLVEHHERLVTKDELIEKVWDGRVVSDSALSSRVKSSRKALGDTGKAQRFIKTIHGRGFRFVAAVRVEPDHPTHDVRGGTPVTGDKTSAPEPVAPGETSRPSIAVLPFRIIGEPDASGLFADALPQDLITELSRLRWLFVIARGSSFRLRDPDTDARDVGRLLRVRYCLSGSIEVSGKDMDVSAELVDTRAGDVVWAERYSGLVGDVHDMRAEITAKILAALEIQIPIHEATIARLAGTGNLDAWSAYHLGLQHLYRFNSRDNTVAADLFERAVTLDPNFARAHAGLSFVHFQSAFMHQTDDIDTAIALSRRHAQRGLDIDPMDPFVNFTMGRSYWPEGDLEQALSWLERATQLSPNYAQGIYARAWTETLADVVPSGRKHVDLAMRLSPLDPLYYAMLGTRGFTHMARNEFSEAAVWCERAARSPGAHVLIAMIAAAAAQLAGDEVGARAWAGNVRERRPSLTSEDFFRAFPMKSQSMRSRVAAALTTLGF